MKRIQATKVLLALVTWSLLDPGAAEWASGWVSRPPSA